MARAATATTGALRDQCHGARCCALLNNAVQTPASAALHYPVLTHVRKTPSNASHTYSIRGTVSAGTGVVAAGPGGSGQQYPAFIRITRV